MDEERETGEFHYYIILITYRFYITYRRFIYLLIIIIKTFSGYLAILLKIVIN